MWTTTDTLILWGFWGGLPALGVLAAWLSSWLRNRSNTRISELKEGGE